MMAVAFADAVVIVPAQNALVVFVMFGWISNGAEVCWNVRSETFAADMLQIMGGLMPVRALGTVFFVMIVMPVCAVDQRPRNLRDAADVDEEKRADRQSARDHGRAGCGSPPVRFAVGEEHDDFPKRNLAEQIAEEN